MPATAEKFVVMPFKKGKRGLECGETRSPPTEYGAVRAAEAMASRFVGVLAFSMMFDLETDELIEQRELARFGQVPDLGA